MSGANVGGSQSINALQQAGLIDSARLQSDVERDLMGGGTGGGGGVQQPWSALALQDIERAAHLLRAAAAERASLQAEVGTLAARAAAAQAVENPTPEQQQEEDALIATLGARRSTLDTLERRIQALEAQRSSARHRLKAGPISIDAPKEKAVAAGEQTPFAARGSGEAVRVKRVAAQQQQPQVPPQAAQAFPQPQAAHPQVAGRAAGVVDEDMVSEMCSTSDEESDISQPRISQPDREDTASSSSTDDTDSSSGTGSSSSSDSDSDSDSSSSSSSDASSGVVTRNTVKKKAREARRKVRAESSSLRRKRRPRDDDSVGLSLSDEGEGVRGGGGGRATPTPVDQDAVVGHGIEGANLCSELSEVARVMSATASGRAMMCTDDGTLGVLHARLERYRKCRSDIRRAKKQRDALLREGGGGSSGAVEAAASALDELDGDIVSEESFSPEDDDSAPGGPGKKAAADAGDEESDEEVVFEGASGGKDASGAARTKRLRLAASVWDALFKYQQTAVKWLWELHLQQTGGVLGDEMGMGKTVQIAAFIAGLHRSSLLKGAVVVVCPVTLMAQWVREFHKWVPEMRVVCLHASGTFTAAANGTDNRETLLKTLDARNTILLTTYHGVREEIGLLTNPDVIKFHYVILDEGHHIRNPGSLAARAVKQFPTPHRIVLTGSPLQNKLSELWALFDFIYPGKLGDLTTFGKAFEVPINTGGFQFASPQQIANAYACCVKLRDLTAPYLLRRVKKDVLTLPEKTEQVLFCKLALPQVVAYTQYLKSSEMQGLYRNQDALRNKMMRRESGYQEGEQSYKHAARNDDQDDRDLTGPVNFQHEKSRQSSVQLTAIQTLRRICNHPHLYRNEDEDGNPLPIDNNSSGKMRVITMLLPQWKAQGHKVLVFTQTLAMMDILQQYCREMGYKHIRMDGTTPAHKRVPLVDAFNKSKDIFCAILSPKVGGLGLNLTGANRVVIYDPDWNPVTDIQARERAWRIGQQRDVVIYRLVTVGTIEEKVYQRQVFKSHLTDRVLTDPTAKKLFNTQDMRGLYTLSTEYKAMFEDYRRMEKKLLREKDSLAFSGRGGVSPPRDATDLSGWEDTDAGAARLGDYVRRRAAEDARAGDAVVREEGIVETAWGYHKADQVRVTRDDDDNSDEMEDADAAAAPSSSPTPPPPRGSTPPPSPPPKKLGGGPPDSSRRSVAIAPQHLALKKARASHHEPPASSQQENIELMKNLINGDTVKFAVSYEKAMHSGGGSCDKEAKRLSRMAEYELKRSASMMKAAGAKSGFGFSFKKNGGSSATTPPPRPSSSPPPPPGTTASLASQAPSSQLRELRNPRKRKSEGEAEGASQRLAAKRTTAAQERERTARVLARQQRKQEEELKRLEQAALAPPEPEPQAPSQGSRPPSAFFGTGALPKGIRPPQVRQAEDPDAALYSQRQFHPSLGGSASFVQPDTESRVIPIGTGGAGEHYQQQQQQQQQQQDGQPTLEEQLKLYIGGRAMPTEALLSGFAGHIGPNPWQHTREEFRVHLKRVAVFDKATTLWRLKKTPSFDF